MPKSKQLNKGGTDERYHIALRLTSDEVWKLKELAALGHKTASGLVTELVKEKLEEREQCQT